MKYILFFLLIPIYSVGQVRIGPSGGSYLASSSCEFNIVDYGASTASTNNAAYINAAIQAAKVKGGTVYIPPGRWKSGKIISYSNVSLKGDGYINSIIESSVGTDTQLVIRTPAWNSTKLVDGLYIENTLGYASVGVYAKGIANFSFRGLVVYNYTKSMVLTDCLVGDLTTCAFVQGQYGVTINKDANSSTLISMNGCVISHFSKWAVDYSGGGQLNIFQSNFEDNGTSADTLTGAIYYHDNTWPKGLAMQDCWLEENLGTVFRIENNVTYTGTNYPPTTTHTFIGVHDIGQQYTFTTRNLKLKGNNQKLSIIGSILTGATSSIIAEGTNTTINVLGSTYLNSTMRSGATITIVGD